MLRALLATAFAFLGLFSPCAAHAASADEILSLAREVCLPHGGNLPDIEEIARDNGWRSLSLEELEAARLPNDLGVITGWAVSADNSVTLTIALPPWTLTTAMQRRRAGGEPVLGQPPGSMAMFGDRPPPFPETASMQFCDVRFDIDDQNAAAVAAGIRNLTFEGEPFGEPGMGPDGQAMDGLVGPNGSRYWHWSKWRAEIWRQINFSVEPPGGERSHLRIYQNWVE